MLGQKIWQISTQTQFKFIRKTKSEKKVIKMTKSKKKQITHGFTIFFKITNIKQPNTDLDLDLTGPMQPSDNFYTTSQTLSRLSEICYFLC